MLACVLGVWRTAPPAVVAIDEGSTTRTIVDALRSFVRNGTLIDIHSADSPTIVVDLFCGCGGFSAGARAAGCRVALGVDANRAKLDAYNRNFPSSETLETFMGPTDASDLAHLTSKSGAGVATDSVDARDDRIIAAIIAVIPTQQEQDHPHLHLHASPPCTSASPAAAQKNAKYFTTCPDCAASKPKLCEVHDNSGRMLTWMFAFIEKLRARLRSACPHLAKFTWTFEEAEMREGASRAMSIVKDHVEEGVFGFATMDAVAMGVPSRRQRTIGGGGWDVAAFANRCMDCDKNRVTMDVVLDIMNLGDGIPKDTNAVFANKKYVPVIAEEPRPDMGVQVGDAVIMQDATLIYWEHVDGKRAHPFADVDMSAHANPVQTELMEGKTNKCTMKPMPSQDYGIGTVKVVPPSLLRPAAEWRIVRQLRPKADWFDDHHTSRKIQKHVSLRVKCLTDIMPAVTIRIPPRWVRVFEHPVWVQGFATNDKHYHDRALVNTQLLRPLNHDELGAMLVFPPNFTTSCAAPDSRAFETESQACMGDSVSPMVAASVMAFVKSGVAACSNMRQQQPLVPVAVDHVVTLLNGLGVEATAENKSWAATLTRCAMIAATQRRERDAFDLAEKLVGDGGADWDTFMSDFESFLVEVRDLSPNTARQYRTIIANLSEQHKDWMVRTVVAASLCRGLVAIPSRVLRRMQRDHRREFSAMSRFREFVHMEFTPNTQQQTQSAECRQFLEAHGVLNPDGTINARGRRQALLTHHPDRGGDASVFVRLLGCGL